jgi:cysteine-rich repeat protein
MNFTTNFYYVRIEIDRAVANQNVRSIGVALETTCGDGTVSAHEACDDGAKVNGDGCSATCTVESGYECTGSPSVCSLLCGNAVKDAGESCDGADLGGEDCLSVPGGFTGGTLACTASCTFDTSACVSAVCGDGAINGSDTCDDGNAVSGDGCSSTCAVEAGYQCTGEPSICTLICSAGTFTGGTCTVNETNDPLEMDYCILQSPPTLTAPADTPTASIFARVFEASFTEAAGSNPAISAQIGFGPLAADPSVNPSSYTWSNATFNVQLGNDDEYQGQFIAPAAGSYSYAARFTRDNLHWTYCDLDGAGSNAGLAFSAAQLGVMTVTP